MRRGVTDEEYLKEISDSLDRLFKEGGEDWTKDYLPRMFESW